MLKAVFPVLILKMFKMFSAETENSIFTHANKITKNNTETIFITKSLNKTHWHRVHTHLQLQYPYSLQSCAQAFGNSPKLESHILSAECSKYYTVEFLTLLSERKIQ
jgi:hypothetical protein